MTIIQGTRAAATLFLALLALPAIAHKRATPQAQKEASSSNTARGTTHADPLYVIGPEDTLDINVWGEPSVSRTVPVRPDGKISLPLLDDVEAAGLTPDQLGKQITQDLRKYIDNPQVTVIVTAINSQRISILGEVNHSGTFQMLPNMTILQALSDAGGFTPFAKLADIYVLRMVNGHEDKITFNYKQVLRGTDNQHVLLLRPGDTIIVP